MMEPNYDKMISLNGTNYYKWRGKMKDLLLVKRLHFSVFTTQKLENKSGLLSMLWLYLSMGR